MSEREGMIATAIEAGKSVLGSLPPAFVMLCLLNFAFLWIVLNFTEHQNDQRLAILNSVIANCLDKPRP